VIIETAIGIRDRHELPSGRRVAGGADFFIGVADTPLGACLGNSNGERMMHLSVKRHYIVSCLSSKEQ
jgi:hypothetical protein